MADQPFGCQPGRGSALNFLNCLPLRFGALFQPITIRVGCEPALSSLSPRHRYRSRYPNGRGGLSDDHHPVRTGLNRRSDD